MFQTSNEWCRAKELSSNVLVNLCSKEWRCLILQHAYALVYSCGHFVFLFVITMEDEEQNAQATHFERQVTPWKITKTFVKSPRFLQPLENGYWMVVLSNTFPLFPKDHCRLSLKFTKIDISNEFQKFNFMKATKVHQPNKWQHFKNQQQQQHTKQTMKTHQQLVGWCYCKLIKTNCDWCDFVLKYHQSQT